jgi:hypothetical protein
MKIRWHTPYGKDPERIGRRGPEPVWPEDWPVPRAGDEIVVAGGMPYEVRDVAWYPQGEGDNPEPFVYVVLR